MRVTRLGASSLEFDAGPDFPADAFDVKLVIHFPDDPESAGSYARVATRRRPATTPWAPVYVTAVFTALAERDRTRIVALTGDENRAPPTC